VSAARGVLPNGNQLLGPAKTESRSASPPSKKCKGKGPTTRNCSGCWLWTDPLATTNDPRATESGQLASSVGLAL
jgi:hypothetical protein